MKVRFATVLLCASMSLSLFGRAAEESTNEAAPEPSIVQIPVQPPPTSVEWAPLVRQSFNFLAVEHGFRLLTEPGTRAGVRKDFWKGYTASVGNLHGWGDGDPFYVNYIGHPIQGAVAGFIWVQNDRRYREVEFGKHRDYWRSRLRAAAFSWAYSEQFEIGLLSEASIGHIQHSYPQQGFVDHVVTPVIGTGWMIAEDALDRYLIRPVEDRVQNNWVRLLLRGTLNPSRSFANAMAGRPPWHRDTRAGVLDYRPVTNLPKDELPPVAVSAVAPFEFTTLFTSLPFGDHACHGGGAEAAYRIARQWQTVLNVGGCRINGMDANASGDALQYLVGLRWTPQPEAKWSPFAHVFIGGIKTTQEVIDLEKKREVEQVLAGKTGYDLDWKHSLYATDREANRFTWTAGLGVDYRITRALAFRALNIDVARCCVLPIDNVDQRRTVQVSSGLVLRMGTW